MQLNSAKPLDYGCVCAILKPMLKKRQRKKLIDNGTKT